MIVVRYSNGEETLISAASTPSTVTSPPLTHATGDDLAESVNDARLRRAALRDCTILARLVRQQVEA